MRTLKPITALQDLAPDQCYELARFLEDEKNSYNGSIKFVADTFNKKVTRSDLERFRRRYNVEDMEVDREDLHESVNVVLGDNPELSKDVASYAATGQARFSAATVQILDQRSFHFALTMRGREDLAELAKIFQMTLA